MITYKSALPGFIASRGLLASPGFLASVCILSAAALGGCASDDGAEDDATGGMAGDGDASGGTTGSGGSTGSGGATGSGGSTGSGGAAADPNEMPSDTSQAGIAAFVAAGTYQSAPWVGDAAPRASDNTVNIHGEQLRVFFNSAAAVSITRDNNTSDMGAMIVKELYEGGAVVGHAVSLKTGSGNAMNDWTHYCNAPAGSTTCTGEAVDTMPVYGAGLTECGFCHGQVPYAPLPQ